MIQEIIAWGIAILVVVIGVLGFILDDHDPIN